MYILRSADDRSVGRLGSRHCESARAGKCVTYMRRCAVLRRYSRPSRAQGEAEGPDFPTEGNWTNVAEKVPEQWQLKHGPVFKEHIHDIGISPYICTSFPFISHMALSRIGQGAEVGGVWALDTRLRLSVSSFVDRLGTMQLDAPRSLVTAASRIGRYFGKHAKASRLRWVLRWVRRGFDVGAYARNP